jgi:hypothetical protein
LKFCFSETKGVGAGSLPSNDSELRPGENVMRLQFDTRMQLLGLGLASLFNQSINVSIEFVLGPLSVEEIKAGVVASKNRVVNVSAPIAGADLDWLPTDVTHCIAVYIRSSSMPLSTLLLRRIELRSLGLDVAVEQSTVYGPDDGVVVFGTAYRRVIPNTTATKMRAVAETDIWASWIPWTALIGSALVVCVCILIILILRKRIRTVTDQKADKFFTEIEKAKAVHE